MTEQVIRHRGGGRDENSELTPATDDPLTPIVIAPGGGSEFVERGRDGESTAYTVYLPLGTDIKNTDELTVREQRFSIVVNDWNVSGRGVVEVLCNRGQG
ncbi:hypothetical protein [Mycobacterium sp. NPDC050041]|uniref:hypothetical protein n=1 Tax=Mycobacterium sp. NPDC050041 TaxID=3364293 RepID=UPI003C2B0F38